VALTSGAASSAPRDRGLLVGVALVAVLVGLPLFDRGLAFLDEGAILTLADEVNRGKVLYRDVDAGGIAPGAVHLLAGWFRVAGTSVRAARLLAVAEFAAFVAAAVALARAILPRGGALVVALVLLSSRLWGFPLWHVHDGTVLAATCLTVAAAILARRGAAVAREGAIAAGVLVGVGVVTAPRPGIAVGAALALALAVHAHAAGRAAGAALALVGGAVLAAAPTLGALGAAGALDGIAWRTVLEATGPAGTTPVPPALGWLPVLVLGGAALAWGPPMLRRADAARTVVLAWAAGIVLACVLERGVPRDAVALGAVAAPTAVLALALVWAGSVRLPRPLGAAARAAAAAGALGLAAWAVDLAADLRRTFDRPVAVARAGVRSDTSAGPLVEDVVAWIARAAPIGTPVPVWPGHPVIGFLAGRETAGGFHVVRPGQRPDRDERILADLKARRPEAIVFGIADHAPVEAFRAEAPRVYQYLVRYYEIAEVVGREVGGPVFTALRRRPLEPPPGAPILAHLPERGRPWPFAQVLAVPLGRPDAPPVVSTEMPFPFVRPEIVFSYGVNPARWLELPRGPFTFEVWVKGELAWSATIDPTTRLADRRWIPAAVDVGRHAGNPWAGFAFRVTAADVPATADDLVGFVDPRITGE
jgi:hypothetical protein